MPNPEISNNDSTKLDLYNALYEDITLEVLGADTIVENTCLAYDRATNTYKATVSTVAATATASAILKEGKIFTGAGTATARALIGGEVRGDLIIFDNGSDTLDTVPAAEDSFRVQLRKYGIIARADRDLDELDNQ